MKIGRKRRAEAGVNRTHDLFVARPIRGGEIVREPFEGHNPWRTERVNVMLQFGPGLEAILARDRELDIGKRSIGVSRCAQFTRSIFCLLL
jgi:hypothetical protein